MKQINPTPDTRSSHLDPRGALLAFVSIAIWIAMTTSLWGTLGWLVAVSVLVAIVPNGQDSAVGLGRMFKWALPFALLIFCLYVLLAKSGGGVMWKIGPVAVSREDLATGGQVALRFLSFIALARSLTVVLTPTGLAVGVTRLLWPLKALGLGVESVYYLMFFIARMVPVLNEEAQIIQFGQRSRGLAPASSWYRRVTGSSALMIPVFAAAMRRSERISLALTSRGFNPSHIPAMVNAQRFRGVDWFILAGLVIGWAIWCLLYFV